jgi:hypothetical protein
LHQRLFALQVNGALGDRGNIKISLADQDCAELRLARGTEELGKAAAGDVEFQRLLSWRCISKVTSPRGDVTERATHDRPCAAFAVLDVRPDGCKDLALTSCVAPIGR